MTDEERGATIKRLTLLLTRPDKQHITNILRRRIFAATHEIEFTNPFGEVDETLYLIGGRQ